MPTNMGEGVIPSSFFDVPIDYGGNQDNLNFDVSAFPSGDVAMSNASDFDALTAQIAAGLPTLPAASHPTDTAFNEAESATPFPAAAMPKLELEDSNFMASSSVMATPGPTHKPAATKAKKPPKPKAVGSETKPKKPKKKPAASDIKDTTAESSKDAAASPAASKPKKPSKKKATDKDKAKDASKDADPSATASPAPFATPASPAKETKAKTKKAGSKGGGKAATKARSSTARSASRMSSIGRDAVTPAISRVGSQRPQEEAHDDDEPVPSREAAQEEDEAEDEEGEADDGVEELGKDHFSTQEAIYAAQQRNMGYVHGVRGAKPRTLKASADILIITSSMLSTHSLLSMAMDEEQLDRHMASRRGALNKTSVRKVCAT